MISILTIFQQLFNGLMVIVMLLALDNNLQRPTIKATRPHRISKTRYLTALYILVTSFLGVLFIAEEFLGTLDAAVNDTLVHVEGYNLKYHHTSQ